MPGIPNSFTVTASGVKNLNVGIRKQQNPDSNESYFRSWVSSQALAGDDGYQKAGNQRRFHSNFGHYRIPSGNYTIGAGALNGSLMLDEITLEGPS